jgi:hypothetical protein
MSLSEKILLAGPWVGEFGYELFCWQAYVRKLSRKFDKTIVMSRPGHKYLYEDFCSEYIEFDPKSYKTRKHQCFEFDPEVDEDTPAKNVTIDAAKDIIKNTHHTFYLDGNFDIGMRYNAKRGVIDTQDLFFKEQEYHKYDFKGSLSFDLIFHCRNKSTGKERNWGLYNWKKLYESLPKNLNIACIGNKEAFYIEGTTDLRGIDTKELVGAINNTKLILGPSSGPMHLASLCGATHLVWSAECNRIRYERDWNPFKTKVIFYSREGWCPNPEEINKLILTHI